VLLAIFAGIGVLPNGGVCILLIGSPGKTLLIKFLPRCINPGPPFKNLPNIPSVLGFLPSLYTFNLSLGSNFLNL
jgi:hypothetical protein